MLLAAEQPVIIVGQGVRYGGAADELLALAERLQIPVACSASGLGAIPSEHPLSLGLVSRNGLYHANQATRQADVLLALGVRFDDRTSSSWMPGYSFTIPPTRLIHVDIDPDEIARNYPVALGLMADVRTFLRQVLAELDARKTHRRRAAARARTGSRRSPAIARNGRTSSRRASRTTRRRSIRSAPRTRSTTRCPTDAILVSDIGVHHNWLLQFCKPRRPDSLIGCMGFGPMGFGVAGVLGAKLAAPDRPCVAVVGDGAFFMHASVLGTAVEYDMPVVWVVWNNYAYASIRGLQRGYLGGRELATDFKHPATGMPYNPDFAAMARSAGIEGVSVDRAADLADAVRAAVASGKPYLIDANIAADKNPGGAGVWELPPSASASRSSAGAISRTETTREAWELIMTTRFPEEAKGFRLIGHDQSAAWGCGSLVEVHNGHAYVGRSARRAASRRKASPSTTSPTRASRARCGSSRRRPASTATSCASSAIISSM